MNVVLQVVVHVTHPCESVQASTSSPSRDEGVNSRFSFPLNAFRERGSNWGVTWSRSSSISSQLPSQEKRFARKTLFPECNIITQTQLLVGKILLGVKNLNEAAHPLQQSGADVTRKPLRMGETKIGSNEKTLFVERQELQVLAI